MAKSQEDDFLDFANAKTMADLVADPDTPERLRVEIIQKLVAAKKSDNFFQTIYEQKLSFGKCPRCTHEGHWLVPEDELNKFGYVTHEVNAAVPEYTDETTCSRWAQSCKKHKIFP